MQIFILVHKVFAYYAFILVYLCRSFLRLNNKMLQFQALLLACHKLIAITLKNVNYKKLDVVPRLTGGQKVYSD